MTMSNDLQRDVQAKCQQMGKEAAMHFCRLAQRDGARFENVTYPTGLKMVRVSHYLLGEAAEVPLAQAKQLRRAGFKLVA